MSANLQNRETAGGGSVCGILYIIKGILFSFILSFVLILIAAGILKLFFPQNAAVAASAFIICFISTLFLGIYTSRHAEKNGLLNGALSGFLYFLITFLSGSVASGKVSLGTAALLMLLTAIAGGAFGGILGINNTKSYKRR